MKCIDEEIPFEIPKGWEWCRLEEISTYAQTKRKINASNADSQLWGLDLEDIEKGGRLLNIKTVGERKAIGDKTIFNRGDILYSKLRPYLLKILVAPEEGICTPEIIPTPSIFIKDTRCTRRRYLHSRNHTFHLLWQHMQRLYC